MSAEHLSKEDMIDEFIVHGFTAMPHPFVKEWIAMPLHHKVNAQYLADYHGWEWVQMGWKPVKQIRKIKSPIIAFKATHVRKSKP